ncbi:MFS general substrate transporter [Coniophora puteana RWD-64-598 SS2]|uniref:MFS general substrate transporter n=1 Tax=Coniophora puteana (strain RWD-64-598) TaxID=741705 RepID=A0A5M3N0X0_CONPW|nr:MFS general substrate transporter [Coniophora puteana RWD-64-598 SS2]EIW84531.1 MFS general substrate transporter [Coniophora puteana RWD-64-598 SS2]
MDDSERVSVQTSASSAHNEKINSPGSEVAEADSRYTEVLRRHGRIDLVPMPSDSPVDPLNWPMWRKNLVLALVAFHAMMVPFSGGVLVPAFEDLAEVFNVPLSEVPYISSVQILLMGIAPIFWAPLTERIGRRPVYLISSLVSAAFALGSAFAQTWSTLMVMRVFQMLFTSPALTIGASSVQETTFSFERGRKMGVWVVMVTCGPQVGGLVAGYMIQNKGWRTPLYLLAAVYLFLFFAHFFLVPETFFPDRTEPGAPYDEKEVSRRGGWHWLLDFRRYSQRPYHISEFCHFLVMFGRPVVLLATAAHTLVFTYTAVLMPVFIPQLFGVKFHLTPGTTGLQFIGLLIGALLGEFIAGPGSDAFVNWRARRRRTATGAVVNEKQELRTAIWPEDRLVLATPGFLLAIVGLIIWGVQLQNAQIGHWNVTPLVGGAIAMFGAQFANTMCVTYALESYRAETADVSVFISFVRQVYGFIAPFYLSVAYTDLGDQRASGLFAGIVAVGMFFSLSLIVWGPRWRKPTKETS